MTTLEAKDVKVVFSYSTPPYVFEDGSGIVITITKEALAYKHHKLEPVFVNIGRAFEMFKYGYVDGSSIIKENSGLEANYSDNFMQYHNAAFALASKHYKINKIDDLLNFNMIAFQNAHIYLGTEFGAISKKTTKSYSEVADQKQQVLMLLRGRTDVIVMDRHIFKFYKNELIHEGLVDKGVQTELFELFEPTKYQCAFKDKQIRDDFNEGLRALQKSGRIDQIYNEYSNKYFEVKK